MPKKNPGIMRLGDGMAESGESNPSPPKGRMDDWMDEYTVELIVKKMKALEKKWTPCACTTRGFLDI